MIQKNSDKNNIQQNKEKREEAALMDKLRNKYKSRSYSQTWSLAYHAVFYSSFLFNAFSFATGAFAIYSFIGQSLTFLGAILSLLVSVAIGVGLATIIEVLKRSSSSNFFQAWIFCKNFKPTYFFGVLVMGAISIGLSFYGSTKIPAMVSTPPAAPTPLLQNIASIEADYNNQIDNLQKQIDDIKENAPRWKGKLNRETTKNLNNLTSQIAALQVDKNTTLNAARQHNIDATNAADQKHQEQLQAHEAETTGLGYTLGYVSLFTELLFLACFLIMEIYLDRCALERGIVYGNDSQAQPVAAPTPPSNTAPQQPQTAVANHTSNPQTPTAAPPVNSPRRTIIQGFVQTRKDPVQTIVQKPQKQPYTVHTPCIQKNEPPVKESVQDLQQQIRDVYKDMYTHTKKNGDAVQMRKTQVIARVKQYERKVQELEQKIGSGQWTEATKARYKQHAKTLEYWQNALKTFEHERKPATAKDFE
jgi:hypothetical protein